MPDEKNFQVLLPLLKQLPNHKLVIAGGYSNNPAYAKFLLELAKQLKVRERMIMPGIISEQDKSWLYKHCESFCFPSIAEGFGLPVVEAMHFNKPLFLSDIPALHDIAGDEAYYFNSYDPIHMKELYLKGIKDHSNNKAKIINMQKRLQRYQWENNIERYIEIYRNL